jgi:hypothetical protein
LCPRPVRFCATGALFVAERELRGSSGNRPSWFETECGRMAALVFGLALLLLLIGDCGLAAR